MAEQFLDVADGHEAVLAAFALAHTQHAMTKVHIEDREVARFLSPHAGEVQQFQEGAVAQALRVIDVRQGQHRILMPLGCSP